MASISPPAAEGPRRIPLSLSQGSPRWTSGLLASSPMGLCGSQGPYVVPGAPPTAPPCGNFEDCRLRAQGRQPLTERRDPDLGGMEPSARWVSEA